MGGNHILMLMLAGGAADAEVVVRRPVVTLGEVVDLAGLDAGLRSRAARIPVGRVPPRRDAMTLSGATIAARARAHMAVLDNAQGLVFPRQVVVRYRPEAVEHPTPLCLRALEDVPEDMVLRSAAFEDAPCASSSASPDFRFDAGRRAVIANRPLPKGTVIARYRGHGTVAAYAGERVDLVSVVGPVAVTRTVTALQSAGPDDRLFVRTDEGEVFSAQFRSRP